MVERRIVRQNVPADMTGTPSQTQYIPFVDNLLLEMEARYVAQYVIQRQRVNLTPGIIVQLYEVFQNDMPGDQEGNIGDGECLWGGAVNKLDDIILVRIAVICPHFEYQTNHECTMVP